MRQALGLIETIGLVAAIEAADAAVKAANVTLLGYENTKGSGKITVKIVGDVGAVNAAVAAAVASASRVGQVYGRHVIARPNEGIEWLIGNLDRGRGLADKQPVVEVRAVEEPAVEEPAVEEPVQEEPHVEDTEAIEPEASEEPQEKQCAATTKSGQRCKLTAQPGSDYCHLHAGQAEA